MSTKKILVRHFDCENDCKSFFFDLGIIYFRFRQFIDADDIVHLQPSGSPYSDTSQAITGGLFES